MVEPTRLVEFFEYNRIIGVSHVVMDKYDRNMHQTAVSDDLEKIFQFYESEGFLSRHLVSTVINGSREISYVNARFTRSYQRTYCMLKNALKYDYIITQDLDEVVGYDTGKFRSLAEVFAKIEQSHATKNASFMIRDSIVENDCSDLAPTLNLSDFTIARTEYFSHKATNMGKTIHSSHACLYVMSHYCALYRRIDILQATGALNKLANYRSMPEVGRLIQQNTEKNAPHALMRMFHFKKSIERERFEQKNPKLSVKQSAWCRDNYFEQTGWVKPVSVELLHRSRQVLQTVLGSSELASEPEVQNNN